MDTPNINLLTAAEFCDLHDYPPPPEGVGVYLNDCEDNLEEEARSGTLALCIEGCVISPGEKECKHGCPPAKDVFIKALLLEQAMENPEAAMGGKCEGIYV